MLVPLCAAEQCKMFWSRMHKPLSYTERLATPPVRHPSDKLDMLIATHVKLSAPSTVLLKACYFSRRYVTVDGEAGRALFYILVEAEGGAAGKSLILWTNGGPGCASSGGGFIAEHGPWYPNAYVERNGLRRNDYAWNRAASVVYLDQPAFTGFSYSNRSSDRYAGAAASLPVLCCCMLRCLVQCTLAACQSW